MIARYARLKREWYETVEGRLSRAKSRAKKNQMEFTLTLDNVPPVPTHCPILHIPIGVPSLDRIDSSKGYTPDNVQWLSWRANDLKKNGSIEELLWLGMWAEKRTHRLTIQQSLLDDSHHDNDDGADH